MTANVGAATLPTRNARLVAVVCQLWCWLGPLLVVALVVRLTTAPRDPFLRAITAEVLNLQLVLVPYLLLGSAVAFTGQTLVLVVMWVIWIPLALYGYVTGAIGAVRAWRGHVWRYPINLHFIADD